jgi:alpha-L-fucosidase
MKTRLRFNALIITLLAGVLNLCATAKQDVVKEQHGGLGIKKIATHNQHTQHPDAQWFPEAGLGLFLHWDSASVRMLETSWPMIAGTWGSQKFKDDPAEWARVIREKDYSLTGKKSVTPNEYWATADEFNPNNFHPEIWLQKAKDAGFVYAVLTTKHHNGFALWPSDYGNFNTQNGPMKGRDLVQEYVDACRKVGLKVGLYFSGPDWHFEREFKDFLYHKVAGNYKGKVPVLDANHEPRTEKPSPEEIAAHEVAYAAMVRGQINELLTNYGQIDVMWFDGAPKLQARNIFPIEEIRKLQPGIVINPRFHGTGDFITPEKHLDKTLRLKSDEWGELCSTWQQYNWSHTGISYRTIDEVLETLVSCRSAGINTLLNIGPLSSGDLPPDGHKGIEQLAVWMKVNGESMHGTRALQGSEDASVYASSKGDIRYLYLVPGKKGDENGLVSISGLNGEYRAALLGTTQELTVLKQGTTLSVSVPADLPPQSVHVIKLVPKK